VLFLGEATVKVRLVNFLDSLNARMIDQMFNEVYFTLIRFMLLEHSTNFQLNSLLQEELKDE